MLLKIHNAYRRVVALCDEELVNRTFKENNMKIEVSEHFFKGDPISESEVIPILQKEAKEDSTFNIVGEESVKTAIKAQIISEEGVRKIQNIPIALVLI